MIRIGFTEIVLFLAPFVLYAVFLWATKAGVMDPESWPLSRIAWLAIAALLLVIGSFIYFAHFTGASPARPTCRRIWRTANSCRGRPGDDAARHPAAWPARRG